MLNTWVVAVLCPSGAPEVVVALSIADPSSSALKAPDAAAFSVGVDIGGTFVDVVAVDANLETRATKVPSRPRLFAALEDALQLLDITLDQVRLLVHGTTVATNALVEKRGANTALITTKGFRDVLEIRRTNRGIVYALDWSPPRPIVERPNRFEVDERLASTGDVLQPLDLAALDELLPIFEKRNVEAVAIVLLHSYINPAHEQQLKNALAAARPDLHISTSSEIIPSYREFERTATTAANAYIAPIVAQYVETLAQDLHNAGFSYELLIMQSNGGVSSFEELKSIPAKTVRSGPAGGAVALAAEARQSNEPNLIGLDIGGTTADVSMVWNGDPKWLPQLEVEFGLPIVFPTIDIISIGAGGGTIAWVDKGGALRAGPQSAGANPGPACYGMGGQMPTGTDAQLVLGRLNPANFLGGRMKIDPELARRAIEEEVARPLRLTVEEAASGIVEVLTSNMIQAVRLVSIERGYDPRDFALCVFGGGGALYGCEIARELNIPTVIVPNAPGVFSAYGLLLADFVHDFSQTLLAGVNEVPLEVVEAHFRRLEDKAYAAFASEGVDRTAVRIDRYAELLYEGQVHPLPILVRANSFDAPARAAMLEDFHREHMRRFGYQEPAQPVEFVNLRIFGRHPTFVGTATVEKTAGVAASPGEPQKLRTEIRDVFFEECGGYLPTPVYDRGDLPSGGAIPGPLIVEQMDTTTVVQPNMTMRVDTTTRNLVIEIQALDGKNGEPDNGF